MANPLSAIISKVTNTLQSIIPKGAPGGSVAGVDIGSSSIKVVQVKKESGIIVLETYGEIALAPYMKESIGQSISASSDIITAAIKDLFKEAHITAKEFVVSLPSPATLIFMLTLPKVAESDLPAVIQNEARKFIPVPLSEIALDYIVIPNRQTYTDESQGTEQHTEVLVVAVRNDTLLEYQNLSQSGILSPCVFEVEPFSIIRSGFRHEITPTMVIDIGAKTTRIFIVEYGIIKIFHVINRGGVFLTEMLARTLNITFDKAEELKRTYASHTAADTALIEKTLQDGNEYLMREADSVLLQYQRQNQKLVQKIIISGGGSLLNNFLPLVQSHFKIPTELIASFDKTQSPEFLAPVLADASPIFSVSAGLALKKFL